MRHLILFLTTVSLLFSVTVFALGLQEAKDKGVVGETPSGYLLAVGTATAEVQQLLKRINSKRRQQYAAIAKKNGISLKKVEVLAGKKAIQNTRSGHFVRIDGVWKRK